jgi:hypothetical protein
MPYSGLAKALDPVSTPGGGEAANSPDVYCDRHPSGRDPRHRGGKNGTVTARGGSNMSAAFREGR